MKPKASIIISSYNRLPLLRRTLWSIAHRLPKCPSLSPCEVILVDDGSTEDVLAELKLYGSAFIWKFIKFDADEYAAKTGMKKFHNNPCATNNIGFRHSEGDYIFQQGNEIIAWSDVYETLLADAPVKTGHWMVMSTTYDIPAENIDYLDRMGSNITPAFVRAMSRWPLQSQSYRSDVTNYISLAPRATWEALKGYDERYYAGISSEDSDFVRRARKLPAFSQVVSEHAVSLHQYHGGKTMYYDPPPSVITKERWDEGVKINHAIYHAWDESAENHTPWETGSFGVKEVITNA